MKCLHKHFIDSEVVVNLSHVWNSDKNVTSVDEINDEGVFEQFGKFNPNNPEQSTLLLKQSDVGSIFARALWKNILKTW